MARLEDKIAEIADARLRQAIAEEVAKLKKRTRFGLVFEEHQPEVVPVHGARIKRGERVALRSGNLAEIWRVLSVRDGQAHCEKDKDATVRETFDEKQLIVVRRMGEAIYPALTPIDAVQNGDPSQPHHLLIEADNYHALQLLLFPYEGKLDCIYIDPPYNTGARDWKYNNDYVDGNDSWRHSKWLTFMARRLKLAKRLLNPADSVLIVTIDEKEYLHLGMLLRQEFPDARVQMVSSLTNPASMPRQSMFGRSDEYIFFVFVGNAAPVRMTLHDEWVSAKGRTFTGDIRWDLVMQSGPGSQREDSPAGFYPIYIDPNGPKVVEIGEPLPLGGSHTTVEPIDGLIALWPIRKNGTDGRWRLGSNTLRERLSLGYVRVGGNTKRGFTLYYLPPAEAKKLTDGTYEVLGFRPDGSPITSKSETRPTSVPTTQWRISSHDATQYGSRLLANFLPDRQFPFPKSLYAVEDTLRFFVANKPDALIVDFFSGSGTTAHAVMRLNRQDGGRRQCISVTNNEVAADEQVALRKQGLQPGDADWEQWGICRHITFPRLKAAMTGETPDGQPIKGDYKFTDEFPMAAGFPANLDYFRLDFLEPGEVQMGRQFAAILPLLWMMAGGRGPRPEPPNAHAPWLLPAACPFAVLMQETRFKDFLRHVEARDDLTHLFVVTNSTDTVHKLRKEWPRCRVVQLYKDYLENFRINLPESPVP